MTRRRAAFLVELLPVLLMYAVGGTLLISGVYSIRTGQKRVSAFSNRFAITNDFVGAFSKDVRAGESVSWRAQSGAEEGGELTIHSSMGILIYRFGEERVERRTGSHLAVGDKSWQPLTAGVSNRDPETAGRQETVTLHVTWERDNKHGPEPSRRFEVTVRCMGERQP